MKNILAFGASSSINSINKKLARFAALQMIGCTFALVDLNDFEMSLFSVDREKATGIPQQAQNFKMLIRNADGIIISLAEHNATYSAAFKNLLDWVSRIERSTWLDKPMFILATSPGKNGGRMVLEAAESRFPHMGGKVVSTFSLPSFEDNFSVETGITDNLQKECFYKKLKQFTQAI